MFFIPSLLDPRTTKWLFVPSILSPIFFVVIYLLLVWSLPKVMKNKEPFQLTNLLVLYNAAMTLLNLYIFVEVSEEKLLTLKGSLSHKSLKRSHFLQCTDFIVCTVILWHSGSGHSVLKMGIFTPPISQPEKTANFLQHYHRFPHEYIISILMMCHLTQIWEVLLRG